MMWALLRSRRFGGFKFRRQAPFPPYVLDFYCAAARLAVELDGGQHTEPAQVARDAERTALLAGKGIRVLRFWNHEVLGQPEAVLSALWAEVHARIPHPDPLPQAGEGDG